MDCVDLGTRMGLADIAGPYLDGYWERGPKPEDDLLASAGVYFACPWYSDAERLSEGAVFGMGTISYAPGGAWQWTALVSSQALQSVDVDGAVDARSYRNLDLHTAVVHATDGTNVVSAVGGTDTALLARIAGRALRALGG